MFTFQSIMFVSLGFLCALLLGFIVAPAFWARAVRLTTERMRASLPLSEQEISAERDRLRAENAIRVHQLTARIERARLSDARQKVEINRRDGTISALQRTLQQLETEREGSENARRVLEATITQRVPEIEARLMEARQLLAKRDAEMKALQSDTGRTFRALDDAMQVNAQQRAEIDRLKSSLAGGLGGRLQNANGSEAESSLRAELESLRAVSREQSALIAKLQDAAQDGEEHGRLGRASGQDGADRPDQGASVIALSPVAAKGTKGRDAAVVEDAPESAAREEIDALKAKVATQAAKIDSLSGQLAVYEKADTSDGRSSLSLRDTKSALKARVAASVKEIAARDEVIEGMRREIATANERTARQASYYQDELRRLGAGGGQGKAAKLTAAGNDEAATVPPSKKPAQAGDAKSKNNGRSVTESGASATPIAVDTETKPSLEERLAAVEVAPGKEIPATDQLDEGDARDIKPQRGKLMDRIAGLAKR